MRDKLAPLKAPHAFGTKRPSLERTYYDVYNQSNVDLVDVKANPIDRFTTSGVLTKDGVEHECDAISTIFFSAFLFSFFFCAHVSFLCESFFCFCKILHFSIHLKCTVFEKD
jgi:hypothetical protein